MLGTVKFSRILIQVSRKFFKINSIMLLYYLLFVAFNSVNNIRNGFEPFLCCRVE